MTADVSSMAGLPPVEATTRTLWMMVALYVLFSPNSCVALHSLFSRSGAAPQARRFSAIRFGLLPRSTLEGLGAYVATIGLPSVLFDTIAHLSFDSVNWYVVFGRASAKLLLVLLSISLAWLTTRRADGTGFAYTLGGVNALLSTMSDDMGIGMPIFAALFSAGPGVCESLALSLFSLSLSLSNATLVRVCPRRARVLHHQPRHPLRVTIRRYQPNRLRPPRPRPSLCSEQRGIERRARANTHFADSGGSPGDGRRGGEGSAFARGYGGASGSSPGGARAGGVQQPQQSASLSSVLLEVIKGFRKNMLVLSVCLASVWNLSTQRAPLPWWLGVPIQIAGQGFKPLVLVVGGMALSSSLGHLISLRLAVLPTILVALKSVVLPILAIYILESIAPPHKEGDEHTPADHSSTSDFVFLYGLLPVATSTLAISQSYRVTPSSSLPSPPHSSLVRSSPSLYSYSPRTLSPSQTAASY